MPGHEQRATRCACSERSARFDQHSAQAGSIRQASARGHDRYASASEATGICAVWSARNG